VAERLGLVADRDRHWRRRDHRPAVAVRAGSRPLATQDDRWLVLFVALAGKPVSHAVDQARLRLHRHRHRLAAVGPSAPARRAARRGRLELPPLVALGEVRRHEVPDRHVEVQQQPDDHEQDEDDPGADAADRPGQHLADPEADRSPTLAGRDRIAAAPDAEVEHAEDAERHDRRAGCRHPAFGRHRLHPQHQGEAGQQRGGERDPPSEERRQEPVPWPHDRSGVGAAEQRDNGDDRQEDEHEGQPLAEEPAAEGNGGSLPSSGRAPSCRASTGGHAA
jgi:hypothetical protein